MVVKAVMQLVEAGKADLDAHVQRYLPWFRVADPQASARMTVRQLLNQTSGLSTFSGWAPLSDFDQSPGAGERQARARAALRLTRPVGSAIVGVATTLRRLRRWQRDPNSRPKEGQGAFGGLLKWAWPWAIGDGGLLGPITTAAAPVSRAR